MSSRIRRIYRNPPIEEALCEFQFSGADWDLTIPGRLREELKSDYPGKPRQQNVLQANVSGGPHSPQTIQVEESLARVQIPNSDGTRILAVGDQVLSVHVLRPYPGWDQFSIAIRRALDAFLKVSGTPKLKRIGLRYINRIQLSTNAGVAGEYFNCTPGSIQGLGASQTAFISRVEYSYGDDTKLICTYATVAAPPGMTGYVLDLDVIWEGEDELETQSVVKRVETLRELEKDAFEKAITDRLRELFDAD